MTRNPINILKDRISRVACVAEFALRIAIVSVRIKKMQKIDLRTLKQYPEKKERIKDIIIELQKQQFAFSINMISIASQPIHTQSFEKGCLSVAKINKL